MLGLIVNPTSDGGWRLASVSGDCVKSVVVPRLYGVLNYEMAIWDCWLRTND